MARLREHPDDLAALTAVTAESLGIDSAFVEKDFWVVEVLRASTAPMQVTAKDGSRRPVQAIFKGGTSLSRVYGLIHRFSEDIDLLVVFPTEDISINARDKGLKLIRDTVAAHLGTAGIAAGSTAGVRRDTRYPYPARYGSSELREGVLLELGSRGGRFPTQRHELRSLVAEHAITTLGDPPDTWEEYVPVPVTVLAPERTLLEKLALVHNAASRYSEETGRARLLRAGRHLYDIHQLLNSDQVIAAIQALGPDGLAALCRDIDAQSARAGFSFTPRPERGFGDSPFLDPDSSCQLALRDGYVTALDLVYAQRPTLEDCLHEVRRHSDLL